MADIICYQQQHQYHQQYQQQQQSSSAPNYYKQQQQTLIQDYEQQTDPVREDHLDEFKKEYPTEMIPILHDMLDIIKKDENNSLMVLLLTKMFDCILRMEEQQKINNNNIKNNFAELEKSAELRNNVLLLNYNDKMDKMINILSKKFNIIENKVNEIKNGNNMNFKNILKKNFDENQIKMEKIIKNLENKMKLKMDQDNENKMEHLKNDRKWQDYYKILGDLTNGVEVMNNNNKNNLYQINKHINNIKDGIQENKKNISKIIDGMKDINNDIAAAEMAGAVARQCIKDKIKEVAVITTSTSTIKDDKEEVRLTMVLNKNINIPSTILDSDNLKDYDDKKGDIMINNGAEKKELTVVLNKDVSIPSIPSELKISDTLQMNDGLKLKHKVELKLKKEDLVNMKDEELNNILFTMKKKLNIEDIKHEMVFREILNERDKK